MICYDIKNDYNRAFLTIWGRLLEQKAYSPINEISTKIINYLRL